MMGTTFVNNPHPNPPNAGPLGALAQMAYPNTGYPLPNLPPEALFALMRAGYLYPSSFYPGSAGAFQQQAHLLPPASPYPGPLTTVPMMVPQARWDASQQTAGAGPNSPYLAALPLPPLGMLTPQGPWDAPPQPPIPPVSMLMPQGPWDAPQQPPISPATGHPVAQGPYPDLLLMPPGQGMITPQVPQESSRQAPMPPMAGHSTGTGA